jgi:cellulose synthase/poly-beta-1,6-N-acetylglucosamine synthase-like glycosyltransferase
MFETIHIIEVILFFIMAVSAMYVFFFAIVSLFYFRKKIHSDKTEKHRFLVLYPAYNEDRVIVKSVLTFLDQNYPRDKFSLIVISDHNRTDTNEALRALPITVLEATYDNSTKAKALNLAMDSITSEFDFVVILDADNIVRHNFLTKLNNICKTGHKAYQCHRCAKNSNNDIAILDGVSEEINNTIFRKAHNVIGLSSALIGSGMCFDFHWFKEYVKLLNTVGEDRELECLLLKQRIHIKYVDNIPVFDEKVNSEDNFQRQRLRWMTAQVQCLFKMLPYLPIAIVKGNIDYIDKTFQQMLIPRSLLITTTAFIAIALSFFVNVWCLKWWALLFIECISLILSMPQRLRHDKILKKAIYVPQLALRMFANIFKIKKNSKEFIHTEHTD